MAANQSVKTPPPFQPKRPSSYRYDFRHLKEFPRRLLHPPNPSVGHVRSFKVTPMYEISLNDVLEGKHLPPLTLKDFEDYLVFEAHSAENLYFICWLRDYTAAFERFHNVTDAEKREDKSAELTISFARARATFFDQSSHLELNLPADLTDVITKQRELPYATPDEFAQIKNHVEGMLRESLMKFVGSSCKNSGRRRGFFAIFVGLCAIAVGLAPVLMSVLRGESRWVRLAAILPFWFGAMTAIAGFHGVCIVIFLFGDARQLYPYELARPKLPCTLPPMEPLTLPLPVSMHVKGEGSVSGSSVDDEKRAIPMSPMSTAVAHTPELGSTTIGNPSAENNNARASDAESLPDNTAGFIPAYEPSIISGHSHTASMSTSTGSPYKFDFDSLPGPSASFRKSKDWTEEEKPSILRERSVFASLTRVISPVVSRAQWEIIVRSSMMGVLVALVLIGICFAVPFKH